MHINVVCPGCQTSYQLSPTLRGQRMRCPQQACRKVFVVEAESPPPTPPSLSPMNPPHSQSPHVSEFVPLIQAEAAPPVVPKPAEAPAWQNAPPPRRNPVADPPARHQPQPTMRKAPTQPAPVSNPMPVAEPATAPLKDISLVEEAGGLPSAEPIEALRPPEPNEVLSGQWDQPPPVRVSADREIAAPVEELSDSTAKARKARWFMAGLLIVTCCVLVSLATVLWFVLRDTEEKLSKQAMGYYKEHKYRNAEGTFKELADKFHTSSQLGEYDYLQKLCGLFDRLTTQRPPQEAFEDLEKFLDDNKENAAFKQYAADLSETAAKFLLDTLTQLVIDQTTLGAIDKAEKLRDKMKSTLGDRAIKPEDAARLTSVLADSRKKVADWENQTLVMERIKKLAEVPSADALRQAQRLLKEAEARLPGISQSPEATIILDSIRDGHLAAVTYTPATGQPEAVPHKDLPPCILIDASTGRGSAGLPDGKAVLALSRGVLYALRPNDGKALWAVRVGIDTTTLPVRVPATAGDSERILVLSSDTETLTAIDENGEEKWRYRLGKPCLGQPLVVDQRAFLPAYDGQVHEVDLHDGRLIGQYRLGQRLTRGGVRQRKSPLIYFPADDFCVYVLNTETKKCEAILYSDHPAGSLRGDALLIGTNNAAAGDPGGWLILSQAQGLDEVKLRVFELPIKPGTTGEIKQPPVLPGWAWFPPHNDGEKLALLSDTGMLGLLGIRQAGNRDAVLFPLLPGSGALNLDTFLRAPNKGRGRSEVVQVQGNDLWVLANGLLQRFQLVIRGADGLTLEPVWKKPLEVGSPLHPSRVEPSRLNGHGTISLTTLGIPSQISIATAIDDEDGKIYWQRQLGLSCQGAPLLLRAPDDTAPPLVLALDQGGGLFAFDPKRFDPKPGEQWQGGSERVERLAAPLAHNPHLSPLLLRGADGESAFEIACPGDGKELVIRHVHFDQQPKLLVNERRVKLDYQLDGTPTVARSQLFLPLADGNLYRLFWDQPDKGLDNIEAEWRSNLGTSDAQAHVVWLDEDRFLCTYGSRGLNVFQAGEKNWQLLSRESGGPSLELKNRLITPPLVLPRGDKKGPMDVCIADSAGVITLLKVDSNGMLIRQREWKMTGRFTSGPFLRMHGETLRIGCVVDNRQLVWIDPAKIEKEWQHVAAGAIIGQPELAHDLLVIADQSGRITALDPQTGKAVGSGFELPGSLAPASTPVSFGPNRLFAPLSDGTVLMLPLDLLRKP